jgi:hypothetical protein
MTPRSIRAPNRPARPTSCAAERRAVGVRYRPARALLQATLGDSRKLTAMPDPALARLSQVRHIVVVMMENRPTTAGSSATSSPVATTTDGIQSPYPAVPPPSAGPLLEVQLADLRFPLRATSASATLGTAQSRATRRQPPVRARRPRASPRVPGCSSALFTVQTRASVSEGRADLRGRGLHARARRAGVALVLAPPATLRAADARYRRFSDRGRRNFASSIARQ